MLERIAAWLGRNDEEPNIKLATELAESVITRDDRVGVFAGIMR